MGIILVSCQNDPIDEIAADEIYTDNIYYLDGAKYKFNEEIETTYSSSYTAYLSVIEAIPDIANGPELVTIDGTNYDWRALNFDDTTSEYAAWQFIVPDTYPGGSVEADIYWTSSTITGAVVWGIDYGSVSNSQSVDALVGGGNSIIHTTDPTAGDLNIGSPFPDDPGWNIGDIGIVRIKRFANAPQDTMTGDAHLIGIRLKWSDTTTFRTYPIN